MNVFFSHSYRDVAINGYFLEQFVREDIPLVADQKSETWCVAKLERYLFEANGFISVVTRRPSEQDPAGYSPYIRHELDLARRARLPHLSFVDRNVLERHVNQFPPDAVAFDAEALAEHAERHRDAIARFVEVANVAVPSLTDFRQSNEATLVVDDSPMLRHVGDEVAESLSRDGFAVTRITPNRSARSLDDVRLLERLWRSELCVFVLGDRLSEAHLALAMAHAHCIPALRLQYQKAATECAPTLQGELRWHGETDMLVEFRRQLSSFRRGFVEPVKLARESSGKQSAGSVGKQKWKASPEQKWRIEDGPGLVNHVRGDDAFVKTQVTRARGVARGLSGIRAPRDRDFELCRELYKHLTRLDFGYETEMQPGLPTGVQEIRTPKQIENGKGATCIDLACLFAALFEGVSLNALIVVVRTPNLWHAFSGYRASGEPEWEQPSLGELRRAVDAGDAVFIETTGVVAASEPVTPAEEATDRHDQRLDFAAARSVATRLLQRDDLTLVHLVDVRKLRDAENSGEKAWPVR